ncbi:hypothetical protein W03_09760 [Nitrosomonas sp. PY1]|uniref:ParB N-terminal domain-containing protein n=1 Tax=Nitrosomonas sp. PY1 TaxID=1803906 RepID=UPI001FC8221D|nr:ParB N-terminal domain-containing protein [Nitrosomonas sp. PY1]GKS68972.1 hypothetical protein W03_09760 [Nitrosomonas sp. PY1]
MIEYELHPLCTLFPRLNGNEFQCLVNDIKTNGLKSPIIIYDGMILDGGNRYRACVEAGVEPIFVSFCGDSIVSFVLSANLHRRHLSPGQQAAIVASAQDWAQAQTVGKPKSGNVTGLDRVEDRMAQSGASDKTQRMADKVAKADPELAKQVAHGEISLPRAIKSITPVKETLSDLEEQSTDENIDEELYGEFDPVAELESANKEIDRLTKIIESDDQLSAAMSENKRLTELCRVLEERMRGYQSSENDAVRKAKMWKEKFEKLEKQVKASGLIEF